MESKALLTLCQENGIDVKNQLSTLEPELREVVVELVRKKRTAAPAAQTVAAAPSSLPEVPGRVRTLTGRAGRPPVRAGAGEPARAEAPPVEPVMAAVPETSPAAPV